MHNGYKSQSTRRDLYQDITDRLLEALAKGVIPWIPRYSAVKLPPFQNVTNGYVYKGVNPWILGLAPYCDPRWITFNQAKGLGGNVRKGEKGWPIYFFSFIKVLDKQTGLPTEIPMLKQYTVFNVSQTEGIAFPELDIVQSVPLKLRDVWANMPNHPSVRVAAGNPCYSPRHDLIGMPPEHAYDSEDAYFLDFFHELIHSTGHESRLNRPASFDRQSQGYAREELIAESGSAMLLAACGMQLDIPNSAAYCASWIQRLKDDPQALVWAASRAQRAADYVLGVGAEMAEREVA